MTAPFSAGRNRSTLFSARQISFAALPWPRHAGTVRGPRTPSTLLLFCPGLSTPARNRTLRSTASRALARLLRSHQIAPDPVKSVLISSGHIDAHLTAAPAALPGAAGSRTLYCSFLSIPPRISTEQAPFDPLLSRLAWSSLNQPHFAKSRQVRSSLCSSGHSHDLARLNSFAASRAALTGAARGRGREKRNGCTWLTERAHPYICSPGIARRRTTSQKLYVIALPLSEF